MMATTLSRAAVKAGLLVLLAIAGCTTPSDLPPAPEGASGITPKPGWLRRESMVVAAHPMAVRAGVEMLREGGNAIDAAVAVQMVLGLVEPQSSGIGGGAFLLHWDGQAIVAWDGRETAPAGATENLFLQSDGKPMPFMAAVASGRSVGVPGTLRMLSQAHAAHGRLPWGRLFEPAIALAEQGFPLSPRLHAALSSDPALRSDTRASSYFYAPGGQPHPVGYRLRNPALAAVLRRAASEGDAAFYDGPVADDIVRRVRTHANLPGTMVAGDLAGYRALRREPICTDWTARWRICGFPPPSSGHLTVMQILMMTGSAHALVDGVPGEAWLHRYAEASRLAYADRAAYIADPAYVDLPGPQGAALLDADYLARRAALIGSVRAPRVDAGQPLASVSAWAPMAPQLEHGTSHFSIVDREGRAVAMTTTVESAFGARILADGGTGLAGGFLLNNELTDFAFVPRDNAGRLVANRVEAGKRPRSSMSPTLVFDRRDGRLLMSLGSAGGAAIIHHTAKTLLGTLAWDLDIQRAIDLPNFGTLGGPLQLEPGRFPAPTLAALRGRGHDVREQVVTSGLHGLQRRPGGWFSGADPRREGWADGD